MRSTVIMTSGRQQPFPPNVCTDAGGTEVKLLGVTGQAFDYLKDNNIKIAIVSCTDESIWAKELLKLFKTPKGNHQ